MPTIFLGCYYEARFIGKRARAQLLPSYGRPPSMTVNRSRSFLDLGVLVIAFVARMARIRAAIAHQMSAASVFPS